jgi:hypothetical protein
MTVVVSVLLGGCARVGRLQNVALTIAPTTTHTAGAAPTTTQTAGAPPTNTHTAAAAPKAEDSGRATFHPLFGDTLIGLRPGTADSSRRYLGRLRDGYTSDTLNLMLFGDNRPGYRSSRLAPEYTTIAQMVSPNPVRIVKGLITIPWMLVKGLFGVALLRVIPARVRNMPTWAASEVVKMLARSIR